MSVSILLSGIDNFDIHLLCIYTKLKYQIFFDNNGSVKDFSQIGLQPLA